MQINSFAVILILTAVTTAADYVQFHHKWVKKATPKFVINATQYSSKEDQYCSHLPCDFYYYLYENSDLAKEKSRNRTVLLVSGFQGNDTLSPQILFKSYGKIDAARIIFFPLANPSGYVQGINASFPKWRDLLLDFPLSGNKQCKRMSTFKILEQIYLKYQIDLTVQLHAGVSRILYPWNQDYSITKKIHQIQEKNIYKDIIGMLRKDWPQYREQQQLRKDIKDDLSGNFVDWAYGASKYIDILSESCETLTKYPVNTMNGLSLALGLGTFNQSTHTKQQTGLFIEQKLSLLSKIVSLVNPQLVVWATLNNINVFVQGCQKGLLTQFKVLNSDGKPVLSTTEQIIIDGDVTAEDYSVSSLQTDLQLTLNSTVKYQGKFKCVGDWIGMGKTIFAQPREFKVNGQTQVKEAQPESFGFKASWLKYKIIIIVILLMIISVWIINCVRIAIKSRRARKISQFNQKFEQIEYVQDEEAYDSNRSKPQQELNNLVE